MSGKKSSAAKLRSRRKGCERRWMRARATHSWRVLILVIKGVRIFLKRRGCVATEGKRTETYATVQSKSMDLSIYDHINIVMSPAYTTDGETDIG
jgi:hypothetical protein